MLTNFEQGEYDCRCYYEGQAFGSLTRSVKAEDAMKLFWPPIVEMMIQYVAPFPKDRKEWIAGFKKEQLKFTGIK